MLGCRDELESRPKRLLVAGVTGAGKSTLARRISAALHLEYIEIDALYHGPGWVPREAFETDVAEFTARSSWVTEWQYRTARERLIERADTLVWLDHPTAVSLARVTRRTIRRARSHEQLWNGNIEPPLRTIVTDREHLLRWAVRTRHFYRATVPLLESTHPGLQIVRLASQREVETWLAGPLRRA